LQDFQHVQVFGFNKEIARAVKINRLFVTGGKGVERGGLQCAVGFRLACPVKLIAFVCIGEIVCAKNEFELFPVYLVFAKGFGENIF